MKIIEYEEKYRQSVCLLFVQLQQHLVDIDPEHVQTLIEPYYSQYCNHVLGLIEQYSGKIYLAEEDGKIVGLVAGYVEEKDEEDKLTNRCPIRGVISELVVDRFCRNSGIGSQLMDSIESYLKDQNCEYIVVNVFEPNEAALRFYNARKYTPRNIEMIRRSSTVTKKLIGINRGADRFYKIFDPVAFYHKGGATKEEYAEIDIYIDNMCQEADQIVEEMWSRGKGLAYLSAFLIKQGEMGRFHRIVDVFHGSILLCLIPETDQSIMEILIENTDDEQYIFNLLKNDPVLDREMDFHVSESFLIPAFRTKKYKVIQWLYWAGIDNDPVCGDTHPLIYAMQINDIEFARAYIDGMILREEMEFDVDVPGDGKCLKYAMENDLQQFFELFIEKGAK